jgi:hypothetical protein
MPEISEGDWRATGGATGTTGNYVSPTTDPELDGPDLTELSWIDDIDPELISGLPLIADSLQSSGESSATSQGTADKLTAGESMVSKFSSAMESLWKDPGTKKILLGAGLNAIGSMATYGDRQKALKSKMATEEMSRQRMQQEMDVTAQRQKNQKGIGLINFNTPKPKFAQPKVYAPKAGG